MVVSHMVIAPETLKLAAETCPHGLKRLANYLKLHIDEMSEMQVARLVWWRISRPDMKAER